MQDNKNRRDNRRHCLSKHRLCIYTKALVRAAALRPAERMVFLRNRNKGFLLWLTEKELNQLKAKANKSGLTDQEFVRSSIMGCEIKEMPSLRFDDILKNLRQINNNLNQIAMKANTSGFIDARAYRENYSRLQEQIGVIIRGIY